MVKDQSLPPSPTPSLGPQSNPEFCGPLLLLAQPAGPVVGCDPRGGINQSESFFCEYELMIRGTEPVNGKEKLSWGQSWCCVRIKLQKSFLKKSKTNFFFLQKAAKTHLERDARRCTRGFETHDI